MSSRMSHWMTPDAWVKNLILLPWPGKGFVSCGGQLFFPISDIDEIVQCLERVEVKRRMPQEVSCPERNTGQCLGRVWRVHNSVQRE